MEAKPRLSSEQRSNLVAYLDGELSPEETAQIDKVLSKSEVARHDVEVLARTWDMLDALPRQSASAEFTQRTMATIAVAERTTPLREQKWFAGARRGAVLAVWVAGLALSAALGFLATNRWTPNRSERLLRELPVIENLDVYTEVDNVEFLKELSKTGLFHEQETPTNP